MKSTIKVWGYVSLFVLYILYVIAAGLAGFIGIGHSIGYFWASVAVFLACGLGPFSILSFAGVIALSIGSFSYAMDVWEWHWFFALLFACPGLLFLITGNLVELVQSFFNKVKPPVIDNLEIEQKEEPKLVPTSKMEQKQTVEENNNAQDTKKPVKLRDLFFVLIPLLIAICFSVMIRDVYKSNKADNYEQNNIKQFAEQNNAAKEFNDAQPNNQHNTQSVNLDSEGMIKYILHKNISINSPYPLTRYPAFEKTIYQKYKTQASIKDLAAYIAKNDESKFALVTIYLESLNENMTLNIDNLLRDDKLDISRKSVEKRMIGSKNCTHAILFRTKLNINIDFLICQDKNKFWEILLHTNDTIGENKLREEILKSILIDN